MQKVPFSDKEMVPLVEEPGFPGAPGRTLWSSPITPRENILEAMSGKQVLFMPNVLDMHSINPRFLLDNRARGTVMDGEAPFTPSPDGEKDVFGVTWLYDAEINGSMVRPGTPLLDDIENWEDVIHFPDIESWDWAGQAQRSAEYLSSDLYARKFTIFTGFFERLISFMDFENAAITLVDEDEAEYVHALFDRLADLYCGYIDHFKESFNVDVLELHDDWGSQNAPLISEATIREMILPHLKRVIEHAHEQGLKFELHSCGLIESLVPLMIEAGVDMWMGQNVNDKKMLVETYGDKLAVEVEVPELGEDASDEEVWAAAKEFVDSYVIEGKPAVLSIYSADQANRSLLTEAIYVLSRKRLCGEV